MHLVGKNLDAGNSIWHWLAQPGNNWELLHRGILAGTGLLPRAIINGSGRRWWPWGSIWRLYQKWTFNQKVNIEIHPFHGVDPGHPPEWGCWPSGIHKSLHVFGFHGASNTGYVLHNLWICSHVTMLISLLLAFVITWSKYSVFSYVFPIFLLCMFLSVL